MKKFLDRHATFFNFTGWLMAILFGVLSIYFYKATLKIGEISYQISRTKIFDSRISTPDIVVTRGRDGPQIKTDVYASEIVLWNSGDLRADSEGNRPDKPISLDLDGKGEIVGSVVQDWNRKDLASYTLRASDDKRKLAVEWNKFRPGFGIRLTVLHTGDAESRIRVNADIFEFSLRDRSPEEKQESKVLFHLFGRPVTSRAISLLPMIIAPLFLAWSEILRLRRSVRANSDEGWTQILRKRWLSIGGVAGILLVSLFLVYIEFLGKVLPPI